MNQRKFLSQLDMTHLLLVVAVAELGINRLAVPTLRPPGDETPPGWHQMLDHLGLFLLFFATTLAMGVVASQLWRVARRDDRYWTLPQYGLPAIGLAFLVLAAANIGTNPSSTLSFMFDTAFTAMLLLVIAAQWSRIGDLGAKIGIVALAAPLLIHYWTPFALSFLEGEEAAWGDLPGRVQQLGTWSLVFAAMISPYCFAPRPFARSAAMLGPLAIGAFVGLVGAVIMRKQYAVGMQLASRGLGVDIGPAAPSHHVALYLMALGALAWTLTSCLISRSKERNNIGVGIALVATAGYAFNWPLQYVVGVAGLMCISSAATRVAQEEQNTSHFGGWRPPPIPDPVWQQYISSVVKALHDGADEPIPADDDELDDEPDAARKVSAVTVRGEDDLATTHVVTRRDGVPVQLRITRQLESIVGIEVLLGEGPAAEGEPAWTLYARPERLLELRAHPEPPRTPAQVTKTGDTAFDQRFRIRDRGGITDALLDDELRVRATALLDGWTAFWPGRGIHFCVIPGRGAPLDHPIPITELAFRGPTAAATVDRLITLVDFLVAMTRRGTT